MIKIISISNAHAWDGVEVTQNVFISLCDVLQFSRFIHTIKYVMNGDTYTKAIGTVGRR